MTLGEPFHGEFKNRSRDLSRLLLARNDAIDRTFGNEITPHIQLALNFVDTKLRLAGMNERRWRL